MALDEQQVREDTRRIYERGAWLYDLAVWGYYLFGMRVGHWRKLVVKALALRPGDIVVEIGCGTGLNFALLERAIGHTGKIIGVDISEAMLTRARDRARNAGWDNVELICCSAADYQFPPRLGGILAVGVLNYEPDYEDVITRGAKALAPGRHWVVLDYRMPEGRFRCLAPLFLWLGSFFGVSAAHMRRHVWQALQRHLLDVSIKALYGGFVYIASGHVRPVRSSSRRSFEH